MKRLNVLALLWLAVLVVGACNPPPVTRQPAPPGATTRAPITKPAWQQEWEKTLAVARSEGKVVAFSSFGSESVINMTRAFKEKFGLDMEFVVGRAGEIFVKAQNERRAGLYLEDVYLAGLSSIILFREAGFLDPVKPLLLLPEVLEPKAWMDGGLKFTDKEQTMLSYQIQASSPILINTDLVKPDEIQSYRDLLHPKWKGKIVVMDPTMGSAGTNFFFTLWEIMGPDFTRELGLQELTVTRDARQAGEWVARGKYPISGNISADIQTQFMKAGAPLKVIQPKEGTVTAVAKGGLAVVNRGPHPNAARVFVNWLLTREAQILMSQATGDASRRLDVSNEWVEPYTRIQPGMNYVESDSEEAVKKKLELQKISADVWNIKR